MTPEELAIYEAHDHDPKFGKFAGTCCMESLDSIENSRGSSKPQPWTLFDMDLVR